MARPDSALKKILDQIETELKKIKTTSNYVNNIDDSAVFRRPAKWQSFAILPAVVIIYAGGENKQMPATHYRKTKLINLTFRMRDDGVIPTSELVAEMETDVEYLISQNPRLTDSNGDDLCVYWRIVNDTTDQGAYDPMIIWTASVEVVYHAQY